MKFLLVLLLVTNILLVYSKGLLNYIFTLIINNTKYKFYNLLFIY